MDRYEYNEFKQEIRLEIAAERKLTYEKRLNEYKKILEPYKNLEIIYGVQPTKPTKPTLRN